MTSGLPARTKIIPIIIKTHIMSFCFLNFVHFVTADTFSPTCSASASGSVLQKVALSVALMRSATGASSRVTQTFRPLASASFSPISPANLMSMCPGFSSSSNPPKHSEKKTGPHRGQDTNKAMLSMLLRCQDDCKELLIEETYLCLCGDMAQ